MRRECLDCVRKHVGSALAVIPELFTDYPMHITYVIGELEQAFQEALREYTPLAYEIRKFRLSVEEAYLELLQGCDPGDVAVNMQLDEGLITLIHEQYVRLAVDSDIEKTSNPEKV